jgi:signal transduction histidine kinase
MDGQMDLESEVGAGSSFFLRLPLADAPADFPTP